MDIMSIITKARRIISFPVREFTVIMEHSAWYSAGDVTFTPDGKGHGLTNSGDEDLVFMALIILD